MSRVVYRGVKGTVSVSDTHVTWTPDGAEDRPLFALADVLYVDNTVVPRLRVVALGKRPTVITFLDEDETAFFGRALYTRLGV